MPQVLNRVEFYGENLTPAECEHIALTRISPELRAVEARLFERKWFDYRADHPVRATYRFAHAYRESARRMFAKTRDVDEAEDVRPLDQDVFQSREMVALWRARQAFDMIGVRYEFGVDFALNRANDRGWSYFPRPNQLYGPELIMDLSDAWKTRCKEIFQRVTSPRFKEFQGHPDQIAHRAWLLEQVKSRREPAPLLGSLLRDGTIPEELAVQVLGQEQVNRAKRF